MPTEHPKTFLCVSISRISYHRLRNSVLDVCYEGTNVVETYRFAVDGGDRRRSRRRRRRWRRRRGRRRRLIVVVGRRDVVARADLAEYVPVERIQRTIEVQELEGVAVGLRTSTAVSSVAVFRLRSSFHSFRSRLVHAHSINCKAFSLSRPCSLFCWHFGFQLFPIRTLIAWKKEWIIFGGIEWKSTDEIRIMRRKRK